MDIPAPQSPLKLPSAPFGGAELPKVALPEVPSLPAAPPLPEAPLPKMPGQGLLENGPRPLAQPDFAKSAISKDAAGRKQMFEDVRAQTKELHAAHEKESAAWADQRNAKVAAMEGTAPPSEGPKAPEAPKAPSGADVPEAPKLEAPKLEAPKLEAPKLEAPKLEAPKIEAPKLEAPKLGSPKTSAP